MLVYANSISSLLLLLFLWLPGTLTHSLALSPTSVPASVSLSLSLSRSLARSLSLSPSRIICSLAQADWQGKEDSPCLARLASQITSLSVCPSVARVLDSNLTNERANERRANERSAEQPPPPSPSPSPSPGLSLPLSLCRLAPLECGVNFARSHLPRLASPRLAPQLNSLFATRSASPTRLDAARRTDSPLLSSVPGRRRRGVDDDVPVPDADSLCVGGRGSQPLDMGQ